MAEAHLANYEVRIEPNQSWLRIDCQSIWEYRDLLHLLVRREFRLEIQADRPRAALVCPPATADDDGLHSDFRRRRAHFHRWRARRSCSISAACWLEILCAKRHERPRRSSPITPVSSERSISRGSSCRSHRDSRTFSPSRIQFVTFLAVYCLLQVLHVHGREPSALNVDVALFSAARSPRSRMLSLGVGFGCRR